MSRRTACLWSIGLFLGAVLLVCLHRPLLHVLEALPLPDCTFYRTTGWLYAKGRCSVRLAATP